MRYFFSFLLFSLIGIAFIGYSSHAEGHPIFSSTLSGVSVSSDDSGTYRIDASVSFDSPRTGFYFSFPREDILNNSGIVVIWHTSSGDIERQLDTEDLDMLHYDTKIFSSPWITTGRSDVHFSIISSFPIHSEEIALMTSYSEEKNDSVGIEKVSAATHIVSRAEW